MTPDGVRQVVLDSDEEPDAELVKVILESAVSSDGLRAFVEASLAKPRLWSMRLAGVALVRAGRSSPAPASGDLPGYVSRLSRAAVRSGDGPSMSTCMTAVVALLDSNQGWLPDSDDSAAYADLVLQSLMAPEPNTRSAAIDALVVLRSLGRAQAILGDAGVASVLGGIRRAKPVALSAEHIEDLRAATSELEP